MMSSELGVERPTTLALSETQVGERRVHFNEVERPHLAAAPAKRQNSTPSPRKPRPDPDFRPKRKRSNSFPSPGDYRFGNRWRHKRGRVLPSKFLLGGSITDPLNLGSLDKEETVKAAAEFPATGGGGGGGSGVSRRSAAVRVIIPPNINDPLNLDASSDNEDSHTDALQRQLKRRRRRKRKRRLSEPVDGHEGSTDIVGLEAGQAKGGSDSPSQSSPVSLKPLTINTDLFSPPNVNESRRDSSGGQQVTPTGPKCGTSGFMQRPPFKKQRHKSDNKIVSPVIPQPGGDRKRHPSHPRHHAERPHLSQQNLKPPKSYNAKNELFQYGNYNKYYGYRNPDRTTDVRLEHLKQEWFEGRDVLDIGCNIGHVSLTVARDFNPKRVVGIDIDKKLVNIAQKNIKHYMHKGNAEEGTFPKSMRLLYGPLKPPVKAGGQRSFPHNVKFVHGNYVLESDELLETVRPEYDLVLCLSITKWIHLNWGDAGLKRFFRRIFYNLHPGGRLVLEPQAWPSYNKRRKLTKRIFENYKSIRLFPDKFNDFLLHEVGFSTSEKLVTPHHTSRGFQRPIIIYTKAGGSNKCSPVEESDATTATTSIAMTSDDVFTPEPAKRETCYERKDIAGKRKKCQESDEERKDLEKSQPTYKAQKHEQHLHQQQHDEPLSSSHLRALKPSDNVAALHSSSPSDLLEEARQVSDRTTTDNSVLQMDREKLTSVSLSTSITTIPCPSSTNTLASTSTISTAAVPAPKSSNTMTTHSSSSSTRSSTSPVRQCNKTPLYPHNNSLSSTPQHLNCNKSKDLVLSNKANEREERTKENEFKSKRESVTEKGIETVPTPSSTTSIIEHCSQEGSTTLKRNIKGCVEQEETNKKIRLGDT